MKKENNEYLENENFLIFISLILAIVFLLADGLKGMQGVRNITSAVFEPVAYEANRFGEGTREYLDTFVKLGQFRDEYNQLKIEMYNNEAQYSSYVALQQENEALRQQITLGNSSAKYTMANILRDDDINLLLIDEGSNSGIQQGDVAVFGNVFVGVVSKTDKDGASIKLPTDASSHYEVVVLKPDTKEGILSKGVVSGSVDGIKIENISMDSSVANGDVVFVNDPKVGGFLTLGYIVGLSNNPASTYKTAYISPVLDYDSLMNVFIKID